MPVEVARAMLKDEKEDREEKSFENLPSLMVPETGVGEADIVAVGLQRESDGVETSNPGSERQRGGFVSRRA